METGRLTPGLRKLEKIAERLDVGLARLFVTDEEHKHLMMMEDWFIMEIKPYVRELGKEDRAYILKVISAAPKEGE